MLNNSSTENTIFMKKMENFIVVCIGNFCNVLDERQF